MPEPTDPPAEDQPGGWSALDTLGIVAGVLLVVIVADIVTDGRVISRRLRSRKEVPDADVQADN